MKKLLLLLAIIFTLLSPSIGFADKLFSVEINDAEGNIFNSDSRSGVRTVYVFAQTACSQCRKELADISANYLNLKEKSEIYVVLVDMKSARALKFYKKKGFKMPVLLDPDYTLAGALGVAATPTTVIVDKNQNVFFTKVGYKSSDLDLFIAKIKEKLKEKSKVDAE
jgi:peroxiredoxin